MDRHKASWIMEFILRQPIDDWLAKEILLRLPSLAPLDPHLQKTLLLRRLSSDLSASRPLSHRTLDSIELLEELDRSLPASAPLHALKAAYCAVAAELTAAPLRMTVEADAEAEFLEAADRIWNRRVADLERSEARGLAGEGLREWRREVEDAVAGGTARRRLLRRDTRGEAEAALREYLRVALDDMGQPLLELMAAALAGEAGAGGGGGEDQSAGGRVAAGPCGVSSEPSVSAKAIWADSGHIGCAIGRDGDLPAPEKERSKGSEVAGQADLRYKERIFEQQPLHIPEVNKAKTALDSISVCLPKATANSLTQANVRTADIWEPPANPRDSRNNQNLVDINVAGPSLEKYVQAPDVGEAIAEDRWGQRCIKLIRGRMAEPSANSDDQGHNQNKAAINMVPPSVGKDGQATGTDEASVEGHHGGENAEMVPNNMAEASANSRGSGHNHNQADKDVGRPSIQKYAQATSTVGAIEDQRGEHSKMPRFSFMERNPTARTCEWDEDSSKSLSEKPADSSKRPCFPTPRTHTVSPLKLYEEKKFVRRRKIKRWTPQEEDALRVGVKKHGAGNWKFILQSYRGIFEDRTEVDLKDKWRNMKRRGLHGIAARGGLPGGVPG